MASMTVDHVSNFPIIFVYLERESLVSLKLKMLRPKLASTSLFAQFNTRSTRRIVPINFLLSFAFV